LLLQDTQHERAPAFGKPTEYQLNCPEEFRPILQTFTAEMVHHAYPLLHWYHLEHGRDYLSYLLFLRRYSEYDFAWILENDVRYTGADWGIFLNTRLALAIDALANKSLPASFSPGYAVLPNSGVPLPDCIFSGVYDISIGNDLAELKEGHAPIDLHNWHYSTFYHTFANLIGLSRRYINTLHEVSVEGNGGFVEEFLLTMAVEERLNIAIVPNVDYDGPLFQCCSDNATKYYEDWYSSKQCRSYALIHPMHNRNGTLWL